MKQSNELTATRIVQIQRAYNNNLIVRRGEICKLRELLPYDLNAENQNSAVNEW